MSTRLRLAEVGVDLARLEKFYAQAAHDYLPGGFGSPTTADSIERGELVARCRDLCSELAAAHLRLEAVARKVTTAS